MNQNETIVERIHREFGEASATLIDDKVSVEMYEKLGFKIHSKAMVLRKMFPNHKLITLNNVGNLCRKYGLLVSNMQNFAGEIPSKNLREISKFDNLRNYTTYKNGLFRRKEKTERYCGYYFICAPQTDFIISDNSQIKDGYLIVNDPVVLYGYGWSDEIRYHNVLVIVTAWGKEASDELSVNEKNN